jgi:hypothetical protein
MRDVMMYILEQTTRHTKDYGYPSTHHYISVSVTSHKKISRYYKQRLNPDNTFSFF